MASRSIGLRLAFFTVIVAALIQTAGAAKSQEVWKYESETVNISARNSYYLDIDFTFDVPAGWTADAPVIVAASPAAQHGSVELTLKSPPTDGDPPDLIVVRVRAHQLGVVLHRDRTSYAEADFLARFRSAAMSSRGKFPSALMQTPVIMSKPGHEGYGSTVVISTVYDAIDPDGTPLSVRSYTLWALNVTVTIALIAAPDRFAERTPDISKIAASFWAQIAHPYTK